MEADLVRRWIKQLKADGHWAARHSAYGGFERKGLHDIEAGICGRFVAIEAKRTVREWRLWKRGLPEDTAPAQQEVQNEVRAYGSISITTWRWSDIDMVISLIKQGLSSDEINATIDNIQKEFIGERRRVSRTTRRRSSHKRGQMASTLSIARRQES